MLTFWIGTIVFFGTYIVIASEKIHKTVAALLGAALMMLFILPGPGHSSSDHPAKTGEVEVTETTAEGVKQIAAPQKEAVQQSAKNALAATENALSEADGALLKKAARYDKLDTFARYSNFDVVFTLAGMMLLVNLLSGTGLFQFVAIKCAKLAKGLPIRTMILLVFATAFLSAFLDNVTTILLVAPVTLLVANELGVPPVPDRRPAEPDHRLHRPAGLHGVSHQPRSLHPHRDGDLLHLPLGVLLETDARYGGKTRAHHGTR